MLETDPNLEWPLTIQQEIKKMFVPYLKLYDEMASTVQTTLGEFFTKK